MDAVKQWFRKAISNDVEVQSKSMEETVIENNQEWFDSCRTGDVGRVLTMMKDVPSIDLTVDLEINGKTVKNATGLHLAAYYGWHYIVDLLLVHSANYKLQTECEKSALHLACKQPNPLVVSILLETDLPVNKPDKYGITPIHSASEQNLTEVILLLQKDANPRSTDCAGRDAYERARAARKEEIAFFLGNFYKNKDSYWFPLNIQIFVCGFPEFVNNLNCANCSHNIKFHDVFVQNSKLKMISMNSSKKSSYRGLGGANHGEFEGIAQILEESKGHLSTNFDPEKIRKNYTLPTNAFGEIEFTGLNQSAKFVRLLNSTPEVNIQTILQIKWELYHPTLVISIFGGDFEKKRKLKMIIKKGLWKAAESAGCWIITEGLNMGIMKLAGEAVRDYTDAYGGNKMVAIGIAPWNVVAKNDVLENSLYQGTYPAIYQSEEESETNDDGMVKDRNKEKSLDTNHSYFFLYDCPASSKEISEPDVQFRSRFEHSISFWKSQTSSYETSNDTRVPICGLVVGGDILTLRQVFNSIIENKCPVVVCQGSSGAADVLALAIDAFQKFDLEEGSEEFEIVPLEARLESIIRECLFKINPEIKDFKKESVQLKQIVTDLGYLVSVFDMEEDWDLDGYIISSLLNSAASDLTQNQLNLEQLEITLTLNRADIAKEKIFLENKKWKKGDLNDYMFNALMSDRHDFVKLFLEQGFSLEEFLTVYILEKLYTDQLKNLNSRIEIFHRLWDNHKTHRLVKNVKLREVGKVIKILVGDFYHPLYLSKEFQNLVSKTDRKRSTMTHSEKINSNNSYEKAFKSNLKATSFNEYKMLVFSLNKHSKSLLHLNYIDQMDIDATDRKTNCDDRQNHSYENNGMDSDTNAQHEIKFSEIIDINRRQTNKPDEEFSFKQNRRRSSSLDMINILGQNRENFTGTTENYLSVDSNEPKINNKIPENFQNSAIRRISSLDFHEIDRMLHAKSKSTLYSETSENDLLKYQNENDRKLKEISLERPARELMIWSLLVGKLQMAELFWAMEKEQIAGALLASMLLTSLANKSDDFTDKEDYKTYSKHFESQAEGVLNECYIEDEKRAQLLINKELKYYGQSSVILLAAQGQSIKFMAHPCCQDFLTSTWYGNLSSKNSAMMLLASVGLGIIMPFVIPKIISYKEDESIPLGQTKSQDTQQNQIVIENSKEDVEMGNRSILNKSNTLSYSKPQKFKRLKYFKRIKAFYFSPVIRFIYNSVSYLTFLLLFSTFLLFKFKVEFVCEEIILTFWIGTLLLEEIKQATFSGISFSTYFSDGWNKLDSTAITLFVIGFILRLITYFKYYNELSDLNQQYRIILTDSLFIGSQTCMGCSLFFFYVRVMYIFSFHIALGPKLIMIRKMISNDLIPFMIILSVFMIGYGVTFYANAYPLGLQFTDDMLTKENSQFNTSSTDSMIMTILMKSYYPMFGEFGLDSLQGISPSCSSQDLNYVPTKVSRTLNPLFLGLHVLLTNVLLFNLLIAMFTKTYEEIESSSVYYWNYQRYQMISEFVNKSPLVPPFIIIWHFYEIYSLLKRKLFTNENEKKSNSDPFCINFSEDLKKERELVKWEHMKAMDYLRKLNEPTQKSRQTRGADGRSLVFRGFGSGGAATNALVPQAVDNKPDFTSLTEEINHQLDKRFKEVDVKLSKLNELESQIGSFAENIKEIGISLVGVKTMNNELLSKIENIPRCQCTETVKVHGGSSRESDEEITKLELAVRSAILALRSELQPLMSDFSIPSRKEPELSTVDETEQESFVPNDDTGDYNKDPFTTPNVENLTTGRLIERIVNNHRLWRYQPFNFELYPGMRMKVPNNMVSWQIPYQDYNAFDASQEILLYPNDQCFDADNPVIYKDSYNKYDNTNKLKRQSMLGQYALDPITCAPFNPTGRTGLKGRGLLPHWGPNHSIIMLFTRWNRTNSGSPIHRKNKRMMQYIALERANRYGIPWFLVDHNSGCELNECSNKTAITFLDQRLQASYSGKKYEFLRKKIVAATCTQIFKGFLDDHLNADNAWVETVVINFHESDKFHFTDDILKDTSPLIFPYTAVHGRNTRLSNLSMYVLAKNNALDILKCQPECHVLMLRHYCSLLWWSSFNRQIFVEINSPETVKWMDLAHSVNLRTSHDMILKTISQRMDAFF